ncbi:hypothetical protein MLOOGBEN_02520 [Bacillus sp. EB106-08-02-XG196]|uniref:hypothetical protein n=1 Tax=Bacillus sp. EB106-08-02-XG196 TaxID=2737049 RepID=UPI0015C4BB88|nr:hypothetical protein [Bacillus sp. EB106-08-02-XG196]NWQ39572.1 hypothetical protein [Bacillus sp. EB106-08-02-XG196]
MEKQLNDLSLLSNYQNRQVILNYYQDEEMMVQRDGFHFQKIQVTVSSLIFTKIDGTLVKIDTTDYPHASINTDFQNYYTLRNHENHLDIYFP